MKVSLVGAGPGEKGLLTLKGLKRLQDADVVLFDRFVGAEILAMIPEGAEKIDVGKTAGVHPVPQDEINRLLLEKAQHGLNVVRLKGGDPFVFGRGGEELDLLAENGIPFEVVPGVSSAIAGAAYAGIPVTHRDYASSLHIITGHAKNNENVTINYDALVRAEGTLVFMMGVAAVGEICAGCITAGMNKDMPAVIVENAATGLQRKFTGTVESLPAIAQENAVESPAIIIIGEVCRLSDRYDWFGKKPLMGRRVIVARSKPGMSTNPAAERTGYGCFGKVFVSGCIPSVCTLRIQSKLADELRELGCYVTELPGAKITPLTGPGSALEKALEHINTYSWLVFTSSTGVNVFFDYLIQTGFDIRLLYRLKIACIGAETEKEINNRGIKVAYCPGEYNGEALAHGLSALVQNGEKLLIARAKNGAEDLTRILAEAGIDFDDVALYEKTYDDEKITYGKADFAVFTSSSAVERFAKSAVGEDFGKIKAVCIGERTAATAKSYGMTVFVSAEATIDSMVNKIKELCLQ